MTARDRWLCVPLEASLGPKDIVAWGRSTMLWPTASLKKLRSLRAAGMIQNRAWTLNKGTGRKIPNTKRPEYNLATVLAAVRMGMREK